MQRYMGELMLLGQISISWCFWTSVGFVSELRSLQCHCNSPDLLAFMGQKAGMLEVLAVVMSLCCTSPQSGTS